jgi:hypothetical protein
VIEGDRRFNRELRRQAVIKHRLAQALVMKGLHMPHQVPVTYESLVLVKEQLEKALKTMPLAALVAPRNMDMN